MGNEVKFIVSAETRQAAAAMTSFLSGLTSGLARVAGPLAALVSAGGLLTLAKQSLNAADAMGKAAQLANATAKEFTGMAYAADRDEVDIGSLRVALKELSKTLSETGDGSKNLKVALLEQADIMAAMPDGAEKNNLAMKNFGRSGLQLIPFLNQGSASMKEMFERGERLTGINEDLAKSADEFNDALKDMHIAAVGLAGSLVSSFIPALTRVLNALTEGIVKFREWTKESQAFKIGVQTVAVGMGTLAGLKLGSLAVAGLGGIIGAGAIKSLADFIAALKLLPAAAAGAAAALSKIAVAATALTAALATAFALRDYGAALTRKAEAESLAIDATRTLTAALQRKIEAEKEAGKISEEEFQALKRRIFEARQITDVMAQAEALHGIKEDLHVGIPGAGEERVKITSDELKFQREQDAMDIARKQAITESLITNQTDAQAATELRIVDAKLAVKQIQDRQAFTMQALLDGALTNEEFTKAEIEDLTEIEKLEASILDLKVRRIQNNFRLTDAEKQDQMRAAGVPDDQLGPNARSFGGNLSANITALQNQFQTFSQAAAAMVTNGIGSAIQGVSDGIMGLIDGTKTWAQTWGSVLKSMAAQGIQFIVQQTAMFLLNKGKELLIHLTTESAKTTATVTGAAARSTASLSEAGAEAVVTGSKAASSVADIPYVGWALAIAAFAGVVAMIATAASNAREMGGPARAGQPHLVGERGMEIFVPRQDGFVLNNSDTMKLMSGGGKTSGGSGGGAAQVTVINVMDIAQAIDARLKIPANQQVIIQTMDGRRLEAGFDT